MDKNNIGKKHVNSFFVKKNLLLFILILISVLGISYAYFNYYKLGEENYKMIASDLYLRLDNETTSINLTKLFPETKEEARDITRHNPNDETRNTLTFTVLGSNKTNNNIYYEILLNYGDILDNSMARYHDSDLVFDLMEIVNNEEVYLLEAVSFDTLNNKRIWIGNIPKETNNEISKTYKIRMWLSDKVIISDTDVNRSYCAEDNCVEGELAYKKHYASIKIGVEGDLNKKSYPSNVITSDDYVENGKSYFRVNLTNDYLIADEGKILSEDDTVRIVITNPQNNLYFTYRDSEGNEVDTKNESLDLTYTFNRNKTITMFVYTESKNDANVTTDLNFKVYKNGTQVQEYIKRINVVGNNYCLNNGFTKFADCILVSENLSKSKSAAISYINSKGVPNVNQTAPAYTYVEKDVTDATKAGTAGYIKWYFSDDYEFNSSNGKFYLKNSNNNPVNDANNAFELSNTYIGYYTCGTTNSDTNCDTLFKVKTVDTANNSITASRKTYQIASSLDSQVGLYAVSDDLGTSYIYRGNVTNNNVSFGGYFWKIVRINGDGSIRLIFNGGGASLPADGGKTLVNNAAINSTNANGYGGATYTFNTSFTGPTYVGYMHNEASSPTESPATNYTIFVEGYSYYWGESYESFTDSNGVTQFRLIKGEHNYDFVQLNLNTMKTETGTDYESNTVPQLSLTPYTCKNTDASSTTCRTIYKVNSITNGTTANVNYISMSPITDDKSVVDTNSKDSNAKKQLEKWYHDKFMTKTNNEKAVTDYVVDNIWCNDRSILPNYQNSSGTFVNNPYNTGYLLTNHTYYAGRTRLVDTSIPYRYATLTCANTNDKFSATNALGNGALTYPVGLITADEVALAGAVHNEKNENFYLRTNGYYWTMSPFYFTSTGAYALEFNVNPAGQLYYYGVYSGGIGLRPTINLNKDVALALGDGSAANPYVLE